MRKSTAIRFPDQPDLTDQVRTALTLLSKHQNGFVLMVESGRIDKYRHSLDPERAMGAPPGFVFLVTWLGVTGLIVAGCLGGLLLGWLAWIGMSEPAVQRTGLRQSS